MARRIQLRRDTAAAWASTNPVLAQGEIGVNLTNNKIKLGDGTTAWNSLAYWNDNEPSGFDGSYNSLTGKPDIPADIGDLTDANGLLHQNDRLVAGQNDELELVLDNAGTLTTPLLLPRAFTAVLDTEHFYPQPGIALAGDPWEYQFEFQVNPDGSVQTIANDPVFFGNPGYAIGHAFRFTEADHGIPGYTFDVTITDIGLEAGGYFTQIAVSPPPEYPATFNSLGAIKFTADAKSLVFGTDGKLTLPIGGDILDSNGNSIISNTISGAIAQGAFEVSIDSNGVVRYPGDITQNFQDATSCLAGVDTVVYTATGQWQHAIKLFVMVEGFTDGGGTSWDTQACDVIAVKGYNNDIVHVTTYGVTYSGTTAIAEFDGRWNALTNRIEITCRPVSATNSVVVSVHAIEMNSND